MEGKFIHFRFLQQLFWTFALGNIVILACYALYYLITQVDYGPNYLHAFVAAGVLIVLGIPAVWLQHRTDHSRDIISWIALVAALVSIIWITVRIPFGNAHLWLKPGWDHLIPKPWWHPLVAHNIRDVMEGVYAKLAVDSVVAKWQKVKVERVGPIRILTAPIVIFIVAFIPLVAGIWLLNWGFPGLWHLAFHHHHIAAHVHPTPWLSDYLATFSWQPLLLGIAIGFIVKAYWNPIGSTLQLYFVEKQVDKFRDTIEDLTADGWLLHNAQLKADTHRPKWPIPPVIRERFAWIIDNHQSVPETYGTWNRWVIPIATVLFFALAGYGGYIKFVIAKGH